MAKAHQSGVRLRIFHGLALLLLLMILAQVWWLSPFEPRASFPAGEANRLIAFSPDSTALVTGTWQTRPSRHAAYRTSPLQVWDLNRRSVEFLLRGNGPGFTNITFSPDGSLLAAKSDTSQLFLCEMATGARIATLTMGDEKEHVFGWRFSPDSRFIIYESRQDELSPTSKLRFWEIQSKQLCGSIEGELENLQFAPDGQVFAVHHCESDETVSKVSVWRLGTAPNFFVRTKEHKVRADRVAISPDFRIFATAASSKDDNKTVEIKLWSLTDGSLQHQASYVLDKSRIDFLGFNQEGTILAAYRSAPSQAGKYTNFRWLSSEMEGTFWQVEAGFHEDRFVSGSGEISPDGKWLAKATPMGVDLFETTTGRKRHALSNSHDVDLMTYHRGGHWPGPGITFSPDCQTLMVDTVQHVPTPFPFVQYLPARLAGYLAVKDYPVARLWDLQSGRELTSFRNCRSVLFAPDGKSLATFHDDATIKLWDVPPGKPMLTIVVCSFVIWFVVLIIGCVGKWWLSRVSKT